MAGIRNIKISIGKFLIKNKFKVLVVFSIIVFIDMVFINIISNWIIIPLIVFGLLCVVTYKLKFKWCLYISLTLLILMALFGLFQLPIVAEKLAIWAYVFLVVTFFKKLENEKNNGFRS
ncbi:hypothetical protein KJ678_03580 [Patescibacteria group bacterium]|nr:hypothetical protein [Patescibacteria group bacterium]